MLCYNICVMLGNVLEVWGIEGGQSSEGQRSCLHVWTETGRKSYAVKNHEKCDLNDCFTWFSLRNSIKAIFHRNHVKLTIIVWCRFRTYLRYFREQFGMVISCGLQITEAILCHARCRVKCIHPGDCLRNRILLDFRGNQLVKTEIGFEPTSWL